MNALYTDCAVILLKLQRYLEPFRNKFKNALEEHVYHLFLMSV